MSFISDYQSRKTLFAEKLISKGVDAEETDGLTTLINKIDLIEGTEAPNGVFLYTDKDAKQKNSSIRISAIGINNENLVDEPIEIRSHHSSNNTLTSNAKGFVDRNNSNVLSVNSSGLNIYRDNNENQDYSYARYIHPIRLHNGDVTISFKCKSNNTFEDNNHLLFACDITYNDIGQYKTAAWINNNEISFMEETISLPENLDIYDWVDITIKIKEDVQELYINNNLTIITNYSFDETDSDNYVYDELCYFAFWNGGNTTENFTIKNFSIDINNLIAKGEHGVCSDLYRCIGAGETTILGSCGLLIYNNPLTSNCYDWKKTTGYNDDVITVSSAGVYVPRYQTFKLALIHLDVLNYKYVITFKAKPDANADMMGNFDFGYNVPSSYAYNLTIEPNSVDFFTQRASFPSGSDFYDFCEYRIEVTHGAQKLYIDNELVVTASSNMTGNNGQYFFFDTYPDYIGYGFTVKDLSIIKKHRNSTDNINISNTHKIYDCLLADPVENGIQNTNYYKSDDINVSYSNNEKTVYGDIAGVYINNQVITGDFEATLECKSVNTIRIGFADINSADYNKSTRIVFNASDYYYLKFRRINGSWTISRSTNGEDWINYTTLDQNLITTENCYFMIYIAIPDENTERRLTFKNLKIYPI